MRSQKQVRRAAKVRSLKNAAAGKWKTYRRRLEDRKAWQNNAILTGHQHSSNTLAPPPPRHRRIKEPKQRSPEELAERQRLREQRRLEKKLAKQRASTSTLPEIKKEKKLKEISCNGSPKNVSAERKTSAKTTMVKNSMIKETAKTKRLTNEQTQRMINVADQKVAAKKINKLKTMKVPKLQNELESKHQYLKEERLPVSDEQKISQSSSPMKIERKKLVQSKKQTTDTNKTGKKPSEEKRGRIKEIDKKAKNDKMQPSIPTQMIESEEPVLPTVLHSASKEIEQDFLVSSEVVDSAEVDSAHELLKGKAEKKRREILQLKKIENEDEQTGVHANTRKVEVISKEQKTKKRSRQLDSDTLLAEDDFVEEDTNEKDYEKANADVTEIVERGQKKKGEKHDEQQSKSVECNNKIKRREKDITEWEKDITEKKESKELDEAVAHLTENQDQSYALENTGFKIEKIMDHIMLFDKIPKDSETLSKTEMEMKAFIPEELEIKVEKLVGEHPEALDATNLNLSDNLIGDVSVMSFAREAKYEVNVEKKERDVLVLQRDRVSRVPLARERIYKLLPRDVQFCVHMIEKHGENYEAMAKDQSNVFRDSAKGIARRIRIFKESPQYEAYMKQKVEKNGSVA